MGTTATHPDARRSHAASVCVYARMIQILPEGRRVSPLRRLVVRSTRLHMHAPLVIALNVRDACDVAVQSATTHRAIHRDAE